MDFMMASPEDVPRLNGYLSVYAQEKLVEDPNAFCLCAMDAGQVVGTAVFDVGYTLNVREISLMDQYRNFDSAGPFLEELCELAKKQCAGVTFDSYSDDQPYLWESLLREEGFRCMKKMEQVEFLLGDASENPNLSKELTSETIVPFGDTTLAQRMAYDAHLKEKRFYNDLLSEDVIFRLSCASVLDGRIIGSFLVEERSPETLWILFAHTEAAGSTRLMEMVLFSMNRMKELYGPETRLCCLNINKRSIRLFDKLSMKVDKKRVIRNYYLSFFTADEIMSAGERS